MSENEQSDQLIRERAVLLALLMRLAPFACGWRTARTKIESEGVVTHTMVMQSPEGQISWSYPESTKELFEVFQELPVKLDERAVEERDQRVKSLIAKIDENISRTRAMLEAKHPPPEGIRS